MIETTTIPRGTLFQTKTGNGPIFMKVLYPDREGFYACMVTAGARYGALLYYRRNQITEGMETRR